MLSILPYIVKFLSFVKYLGLAFDINIDLVMGYVENILVFNFFHFFAHQITPSVPSTVQQTSTVAQPTSSTPSTLLGPSPFDRSHSMAMGLRASLPKLPSFKRRAPEPKPDAKKTEELTKSLLDKTVGSPVSLKRRRAYDSESEHDTEVELSSREGDKRPRTVSSLVDDGDDERSQSPWQQLDDAAPPAMDVRISKGTM